MKTALLLCGVMIAMATFVGVAMNLWIRLASWSEIHESAESVPVRSTAIVLGASVYSDGRPTVALEGRLEAALALYESKKVERILITGTSEAHYDETGTMRAWLLRRGVPEDRLILDGRGLRTLDSMVRAARVFGVKDACICTQSFHLPRALFLARRAGIDAVGLDAGGGEGNLEVYDAAREFLARIQAFVDAYVLRTEAHSLEPGSGP
jgi:SanA protein